MENHTWDLVYLPNGKKAIQCKWLAKIKTDKKGEPSVYKSRLVAKGLQQKEKENYKEVSSWVEQAHEDQVALAAEGGEAWDTGSDLRENSATASRLSYQAGS
ncbi:hypothetical protein CLOM_g16240 [Closterium sp. NIES-68]|nr:hypothetical protein CLOM_g16240 [Closterium sp. NIES-68]